MSPSNRARWFADVLRAGLDTRILSPPDILTHATPAVLIAALPKDVVVRLLDATLATGTMSPDVVLQTATPEILAEHVPQPVTWECLAAAAQRAGFAGDGTPDAPGAREFLRRAIDQALLHGIATPKDIVDDVNATVIGHHFPDALKTRLLEASLAAGKMNPELILETLGTEAIASHAPTHVVWASLARTGAPPRGEPRAGGPTKPPPLPELRSMPGAGAAPPGGAAPSAEAAPTAEGALFAPPPLPEPPPAAMAAPPEPPGPQMSSAELVDDDGMPSVLVELDDVMGSLEAMRDKDAGAPSSTSGTIDEKKRTVSKHTTKRA